MQLKETIENLEIESKKLISMNTDIVPVYSNIQAIKPPPPKQKPVPKRPKTPPKVEKKPSPKKLPKGASMVDQMIYDYEVEHGNGEFLFERISDGNYKFGTKKCTAKISNGVCLIRVGGGYMDIAEFYSTYSN
jgi:hypothetical protein